MQGKSLIDLKSKWGTNIWRIFNFSFLLDISPTCDYWNSKSTIYTDLINLQDSVHKSDFDASLYKDSLLFTRKYSREPRSEDCYNISSPSV